MAQQPDSTANFDQVPLPRSVRETIERHEEKHGSTP